MITKLFWAMAVGIGGVAGTALADAKEEVQAAVNRLAEAGSYAWTSTVEAGGGGMRGGPTEGKTQKNGPTMLRLSMRDDTMEVYIQNGKAVFNSPDEGWQAVTDAPREPGTPGGPGGGGPGRMIGNMARNFRSPADQAKAYLEKVENLTKAEDGSYTGTLPEDEAKAAMRPRRGGPGGPGSPGAGGGEGGPEIRDAKATVTFWASDGVLSKFQSHVSGVVTINGDEREVDRTTTVQIKDVGTTTVEVPEEAKEKMK